MVPLGLANDNWQGYVDRWIYDNNVTWMETTCATPYWTGMMLFSIVFRRSGSKRVKHLLHNLMFQQDGWVAYMGHLSSAPMDWSSMVAQLKKIESAETHISLPGTGEVLASWVRIVISSGLLDLSSLLKQATVRRNVVV